MAGLIDLRENQVLDRLFGQQALTPPATWYIGLFTTIPNDDGTGGVEVVGGSYARVAVANTLAEWPAASGGSKNNANPILFPTASAGWGTVKAYGFFDAAGGGNLWGFAPLDAERIVLLGDDFRFLTGAITITLD
jgi:hypothetical protein